MTVFAGATGSNFSTDVQAGDIADADRHRPARADDHLTDIGQRFKPPAGANRYALTVTFDDVGTAADIVGFYGLYDVAKRKSEGDQLGRIRVDVVLLDVAAD